MGELALQPEEIESRRKKRAFELAVLELPLLRIIGFAFVSLGLFLNNRFILGDVSLRAWGIASVLMAVYCVVSWAALYAGFRKFDRDLSLVFITLDVVLWTYVIYVSGAEQSWLYIILLVRVADQTHTTFRRCLA